jgi:lipopolysaccharide export system protein LptA
MQFFFKKIFIALLCCVPFVAGAQPPVTQPGIPNGSDTLRIVKIVRADRISYKKMDSIELDMIAGDVALLQEGTYFYCDSAVINRTQKLAESFGRVHINDGDSIHTYARYLRYFTDRKLAYLKGGVRLNHGKGVLTTEDVEYDMNAGIATYKNNGKIVNGKTVLTSKEGVYFENMKEAHFKKDVVLIDPRYTVRTDSLVYNLRDEVARFVTKTFIRDSSGRTIVTNEGFYDMKNGTAQFGGSPVIKDGAVTVMGDRIASDDKTGISQVQGNAVIIDTAQGTTIIAGNIWRNKNTDAILATGKPLMIIKQDQDSIYVSADTLFSARLTNLKQYKDSVGKKDTLRGVNVVNIDKKDSADNNRYLEAFHNVRIFSDSLQARCDSMFYSLKDSIFRLYEEPVVWGNKNQITGDTIYLFTKNKKAERLFVRENAMVVSLASGEMFNQVSGNVLNGYFEDGNIKYMRMKGNAESIYYVQDEDSAYIGVNKASGDAIDIYFENKELQRVVFVKDVKGVTYPIRDKSPEEMRLPNFRWLEERRPKTKYELYE